MSKISSVLGGRSDTPFKHINVVVVERGASNPVFVPYDGKASIPTLVLNDKRQMEFYLRYIENGRTIVLITLLVAGSEEKILVQEEVHWDDVVQFVGDTVNAWFIENEC